MLYLIAINMLNHDLGPGRQALRILLIPAAIVFLASCDSSSKITPPPPDPDPVRVTIDVSPDWVDVGWVLQQIPREYAGVGDSVLVLDDVGEYLLHGGTGDDLHLPPDQVFQRGEAVPGDSLLFNLDYSQVPWQARYPGTGLGIWYDIVALEDGGALVCGELDQHPRVAVVDRNGAVQWIETTADPGLFTDVYPLGEAGYLLSGFGPEGIILSNRNPDGVELWWQDLDLGDSDSVAGVTTHGAGEFLLLANTFKDDGPIFPVLIVLDGAGQIQARHNLAGPLNRVAAGLAPRVGGGAFILQARLLKPGTMDYQAEVILVGTDGTVDQTRKFGTCEAGHGSSILGLADGGAVFCYLTHDLSDELGSTEVVRLSSSGSTVWHISLNLEGFERLAVCQEGPDGRILLAGNSHRYVPEDFRTWLVELDADGQELRNMTANTASFRSRIWSACRAWDGGLFWAGSDLDPATSEHEAWVVRTDWSWFTPPDPH